METLTEEDPELMESVMGIMCGLFGAERANQL